VILCDSDCLLSDQRIRIIKSEKFTKAFMDKVHELICMIERASKYDIMKFAIGLLAVSLLASVQASPLAAVETDSLVERGKQ
jgi:hypothetical protein